MSTVLVAILTALAGAALGLSVPRLIGSVPEPEPEPVAPEEPTGASAEKPEAATATRPPAPPKELYADIARLPRLGVRSAVVGALLGAAFGWRLLVDGREPHLLHVLPLLGLGMALAVIDWRTRLLPKRLIAPAYPVVIVLVLVASLLAAGWVDIRRAAIGWAVMGGFYALTWVLSRRMLGYGDVRLAGLLGISLGALGWGELIVGMYAAFLMNALPGLVLLAVTRDRKVLKRRYPFGPSMLAGAALGVLVGGPLWHGYLGAAGLG